MRAGHDAARCGDDIRLRTLGRPALVEENTNGRTPAHGAAQNGHERCLRALHELGAADTLAAADNHGYTPAHVAVQNGHERCLRALHELGAADTLAAANNHGYTPAHGAAQKGHERCLRALHELGAADTLAAADNHGYTPAHYAAQKGHERCLRALHELLSSHLTPQILFLKTVSALGIPAVIRELQAKLTLSWSPDLHITPADFAARENHVTCFRVLAEVGGAAGFWNHLVASPAQIEEHRSPYPWLLSEPSMLDLACKRAWLSHRLGRVVRAAGEVELSLVARRDNVLEGLCARLGVDEATGQLMQGTLPQRLGVTFTGEASAGDSLRREWFGLVTAEILDRDRGLFISKDDNRTLEPRPDSGVVAGADHLSYFALLGRIAGLALFHREPLNVSWTSPFLKAAFGYAITFDDLAAYDPKLHASLKSLLDLSAENLKELCLNFEATGDESVVYEAKSKRRHSTELKPGGEDEAVRADNVQEYLQLYARYRLVGAYQAQVDAFRSGLGVFFTAELLDMLRKCCTVTDLELLLCGAPSIDVDDWQSSTKYEPPSYADSKQVRWFWAYVRAMPAEMQARLLFFCSSSTRPPATGFASLMGYNGQENRFTVARIDGADAGRLPTAHACFNKLDLPEYATEALLRDKLQLAISGARGFDEGAVAQ